MASNFKPSGKNSVFAPDRNIKGGALAEFDDVPLVLTFFNTMGSITAVHERRIGKTVVLLFDPVLSRPKCPEVNLFAGNKNVSVYCVAPKGGNLVFRTICKNGVQQLGNCKFIAGKFAGNYISTSKYGDIAVELGNYLVRSGLLDTYRVLPFGFQTDEFMLYYTEYLKQLIGDSMNGITDVFMVIGSGTTLISLYQAVRELGLDPNFHCTVVGKTVDEEFIMGYCPGIKVRYYSSGSKYTEPITDFPECDYGLEQLNELMKINPKYDSKLLYGVQQYVVANNTKVQQLENCLFFHVA